ncbi:diguanylate cyclase [Allorhizobium sp. BGMRC 0089]|uniref:diguanylate cyclase domain-containing protein n=1 Tax=Allorhizobium sonneratiae TaxID=2934936 RepID=UPI0020342CC1|nr:diguanylate cyclase [Allorhizobium sonneratiae]MCM2291473.1 diguanylate cyclase [Allorhizobium sonneratiae]
MPEILTLILINMAIAVLSATVLSYLDQALAQSSPTLQGVGIGLAGGMTSIIAMMFPIAIATGVYLDLRTSAIAVSGMLGGPIAALVSAAVAMWWRWHLGGGGVGAGILSILIVAGVAIAASSGERRPLDNIKRMSLVSLGSAVLPNAAIFVLPQQFWSFAFDNLSTTIPLLFAATFLSCLLLRREMRHRALQAAGRLYRIAAETLPESMNIKDRHGHYILANPTTAKTLGVAGPQAVIGRRDADFIDPVLAETIRREEQAVFAGGKPVYSEHPFLRSDGSKGWCSTLKNPVRDERTGEIVAVVTHDRDITAQKLLERQLEESRQKLEDVLANMADGLALYDRQGRLVYCNDRYRDLFPKTADLRVPGVAFADLLTASRVRGEEMITPDSLLSAAAPVFPLMPGAREIRLADGRTLEARTRSASNGGSLMVFSDITLAKQAEEMLVKANRTLAEAASTDGLTGLANRRAFDERLAQEWSRARRNISPLGLILVDIDHFKLFNDRYGHQGGDDCLRQVAQTLKNAAKRATDLAARYGGEEMALILPDTDLFGTMTLAERYRSAVRALAIPHEASSKTIVTVSIGAASLVPDADQTVDMLVALADKALYAAKAGGRDCTRPAETVLEERFAVPLPRQAGLQ